jgi:hypothetical protein
MSLTPIAADPVPVPPAAPAFSISATIELAKGIMARGFTALLLCSLMLLAAQVPPQILATAQAISAGVDRSEQGVGGSSGSGTRDTKSGTVLADINVPGQTQQLRVEDVDDGTARGALRKLLLSDGPDPSPRTMALGVASNCFSILWGFGVQLPLGVGAFLIAIRIARGELPGVMEMFHGYRRLPAQWGAVILQYLASMPLYAVSALLLVLATVLFVFPSTLQETAPAMKVGAAAVGGVLILVSLPVFAVATWIAVRMTFCVLAVVDPGMGGLGPIAAVGSAWRISKGNVFGLIGLFMIVFVIAMATALCCIVPLFVIGLPTIFALFAAAWLLLMRRERPNAPELIVRGPDGAWGLQSARAPAFDPSASVPPDFRA